jgi:hypothetical protein
MCRAAAAMVVDGGSAGRGIEREDSGWLKDRTGIGISTGSR